MNDHKKTVEILIKHFHTYPALQLQDIFKFLHQSSFGCEHLLTSPSATIAYIQKEAAACKPHLGELTEPLDGQYCRVHLDWLKDGLSAETFGKLFLLSAEQVENGSKILEEKLTILTALCEQGLLPFSKAETQAAIAQWMSEGYPACHHSDSFRNAYSPAYRLIKKEYVPYLSLLADLDRRLTQGRIVLAIEGGSASGKTTLGMLLEQIYDCIVFHMDDFFLQPHQRTHERLAEAGGNIDRERFLEEVLLPMQEQKPIVYSRFDCSTFTLGEPVTVIPTRLCVIEGAYSMHPNLAEHYDMSVFLDITPSVQKKRIQKRNSPEIAERFFREWIPMEHKYFDAFSIKECCDSVIPILE